MPIQQEVADHPEGIVGYAAVHHGLLGLLKDIGHSGESLSNPEKHTQFLQDAKKPGNKLHDSLQSSDYESAAAQMHEHPLVGEVGKKNLNPVMQRMAYPVMLKDPHPHGFRTSVKYLDSAIKGHNQVHESFKHLLGKPKEEMKPDVAARESLSKHLDELHTNPDELLNVGGSLGHYLPMHAITLASHAVSATQYLSGLKPQRQQLAPLDAEESVDKQDQATYNRQLDIAQNPLLIVQHIQDGTLLPQDLTTLATIYPGLHKKMVTQGLESLIDAKTHDVAIPYKQKQTLSMLLGQPLDFTQSSAAAQAIIMSQAPQKMAQQEQAKGKIQKSGASAATQRTIEKTDALYQTPQEARQIKHRA